PFNRVGQQNGYYRFSPIRPQHSLFVKLIKINRIRNSLDRIIANNGKLKYECLWVQNDEKTRWMCVFALDVYEWKDMGANRFLLDRGCAGVYTHPSGHLPLNASRGSPPNIWIPDAHPLDPFGG
ncbi:MAG: hypothetical protein WAL59_04340, partial [Roseiarcus sp.]